jgi:tetratricopeptide (TPR) repeat protein
MSRLKPIAYLVSVFLFSTSTTLKAFQQCDPDLDYQAQGGQSISEGDYEQAIAHFSCAIVIAPEAPENYLFRASAYGQLFQFDAATDDVNRAIELSVESPFYLASAYAFMGNIRYTHLDYSGAVDFFTQTINIYPGPLSSGAFLDLSNVYVSRGNAYVGLGDYEQALADFDQAIQISGENAFAYASRGFLFETVGQSEIAAADFQHALEIDESVADVFGRQGSTFFELENYEQAIEKFSQAIQLQPDLNGIDYTLRGIAYVYTGMYELAVDDLSLAINLQPAQLHLLYFRGWAYLELQGYEQSIRDLTAYLEYNPYFPETYLFRGRAYSESGHSLLAFRDYLMYLSLLTNQDAVPEQSHSTRLNFPLLPA